MFCSLDRVDMQLKSDAEGRPQYVQTDHRSSAEIAKDVEVSTLFALIRVLNPKRMVELASPEPSVVYACQQRPPKFLSNAIASAGGRVVYGADQQVDDQTGFVLPLEESIKSAFSNLADKVAADFNVEMTIEGLSVVESRLAQDAGRPEEDEYAYWSAVVRLGSFGGEILRRANGGTWLFVTSGSLPFALSTRYQGEEATVNPLGKAIKRFENGAGESLVNLVRLICGDS